MPASVKDKTVLITGCSSGFGRLMAEKFWRTGWHVIATTRQPELLDALRADNADNADNADDNGRLRERQLHVLRLNVADAADRKAIISFVTENYPDGLDCLINNAGYSQAGPLESLSEEQIRKQFEVNVFAPIFLTRDLLPSLRAARGKVINLSSVLGFVGMPLQSMYVSSKFALEGLTESLYYELAEHGVQVTIVEPGGFRTRFAENIEWPTTDKGANENGAYSNQVRGLQRFLQLRSQGKGNNPEQVAAAVVKLANQRSMPLRVRVGVDCQAMYLLRRSLPQRNADRLFLKLTTSILKTQ